MKLNAKRILYDANKKNTIQWMTSDMIIIAIFQCLV